MTAPQPGAQVGYTFPPRPLNPSGAPNSAYAAPRRGTVSPTGTAVPATWPGDPWSPPLKSQPGSTPDPMRTGRMPIHTMYPDADEPPAEFYNGVHGPARNVIQRHGVEYQKGNEWATPAPTSKRFENDPRWTIHPEARPTARNSPNFYSFTRPYNQRWAARLNGVHFSMADHRRDYPVFGMAPAPSWRNTSRVDPVPWDSNIADTPHQLPQNDVAMNSQRFVLGG